MGREREREKTQESRTRAGRKLKRRRRRSPVICKDTAAVRAVLLQRDSKKASK